MRNLLSEYLYKSIGNIRDPLYRNSIYLAIGKFFDAGIGFAFWTLAARLYNITDVGIATALISSLLLVIAISRLGFDTTIIRFMPSYDHAKVFNTSLLITTAAAIIASILFLATVGVFSPDIAFIKNYSVLFILIVIVSASTSITGNALLAVRRADQKLIQNIIMGSRLFLLLPFVFLGSIGIFFSTGLAYLGAAIYAMLIMRRHLTLSPNIDREFVNKTVNFSFFNYIAGLLQVVPTLVLPLLIVNVLSPEDSALYYIAYAIGGLVLIIPDALSTSFFVEGSHGMNLRKVAVRTLLLNYAILIPAILVTLLLGDHILMFFGEDYVAAFPLLQIIVVSSLLVTLQNLFIPIQNIRLKVRGVVTITLIRFILLLGFSWIFMHIFGIIGVGYAWAVTYLILGGIVTGIAIRDRWV